MTESLRPLCKYQSDKNIPCFFCHKKPSLRQDTDPRGVCNSEQLDSHLSPGLFQTYR